MTWGLQRRRAVRTDRDFRLQRGFARPFVIGLLAVVAAGAILLSARAILVDRDVHRRYESALAYSELSLTTGQLAAVLAARAEPGAAVPQHSGPLIESLERVRSARTAIDAHDSPDEAHSVLRVVDELLFAAEALNGGATDSASRAEASPLPAWRALQKRAEALQPQLLALARAKTATASRAADSFIRVARIGIIVFAAIATVLAVVLGALTLRTLRSNRELLERMQQIARLDPLTGAINRRGLDDALATELSRAHRTGQPLTLVMLDLDHFKRYNDRRGHAAGDAVLRGAAQGWLKQLRPTDALARYGGEEFTLLLPSCDSDQAAQLVSRLRPVVPDHQTFSAGIARWDGVESAVELIQRADAALLQAKKAGRARTMIAGREPQVTLPLKVA